MAATKLIPYEFRVGPTEDKEKSSYWDLVDLSQNSIQTQLNTPNSTTPLRGADDFIDFIAEFCDEYESGYRDFKEERLSNATLALTSNWKQGSDWVEGNLYLGNSGVVRSILHLDSGKRDERGRDMNDAEERPIYFLIYISSKRPTRGYMLLERSPRYGVKGALQIALRQWLNDNYAEKMNIEVEPIPTGKIFPPMRESDRTVRLRFEKDGHPSQIHPRFNEVFETEEMKQATEFRAKSKGDMRLIVDELEAWYNEAENSFEEIDGQTYDNVKITIGKNNAETTISITKGEMPLRRDIDLNKITNEGDLPALPEISSQAHSFLRTVVGYDTGTYSLFSR